MLIDLTRKIESGMPVYPGDPLFQTRVVADHSLDGFRCSCWTIGSHLGTHLDLPFHQFVDGETVADLSLDFFAGKAAIIDLSIETDDFYSKNPSAPFFIEPKLLEPFEQIFENVSRIIIRTGWEQYWRSPSFYRFFPSILPETAEWIADFPIKLLGLETPSLAALSMNQFMNKDNETVSLKNQTNRFMDGDETKTVFAEARTTVDGEMDFEKETINEIQLHADQECHRILLGRRPPILLLEGLVDLEQLPAFRISDKNSSEKVEKKGTNRLFLIPFEEIKTFSLYCFPLNIENADGCPVRAVAEINS